MFTIAILAQPGSYACHASTDRITLCGPAENKRYYRVTVAGLGACVYLVRDDAIAACIWR